MSNAQPSQELEQSPLTPTEQSALRYWYASNQPEISPDTATRMFQLFLQGQTCDQIRSLNKGYSLGQVVRARVAGEWDKLRSEYQRDLLELTRIRAMQETLETTNFVGDMLAAARTEFGEKFRKYILTHDSKELGALRIESIKDLKDAVALFQMLTGQDKKQTVQGEVLHRHEHGASEQTAKVIGESLAPAVAAEVLQLLGQPATRR